MRGSRANRTIALSVAALVLLCGTLCAETVAEKRAREFKTGQATEVVHGEDAHGNARNGEGNGHEAPASPKPAPGNKSRAQHGKVLTAPPDHGKAQGSVHGHHQSVSAGEALKILLAGNKRYVTNKATGPNRSPGRRTEIAKGQHPLSIIVSCSDSRVPPEIVFDQGLGDLFVVRTAGNVVDDLAIGSIEYAVDHLGVNLIMVLGHEKCGAVDATVKGGAAPGQIGKVVESIKPALERARGRHGDYLANCVKANVKGVAEKIRGAKPIISEYLDDGTLKVVGAYYDLESGRVTVTYNPSLPM